MPDSGVGLCFCRPLGRMGRKPTQRLCRFLVLVPVLIAGAAGGCASGDHDFGPAADDNAARLASASLSDSASDMADESQLADPFGFPELEAVVIPPAGWTPDPMKRSRSHAHQAWVSPTRHTAYGVIRMNLPLPFIGPSQVLGPFLDEMRRSEGEATLISRQNDPKLGGIRFVAEGGQYRIRANLVTRGFRAWAVYAGTLIGQDELPEELQLAEAAREQTRVGTTRVRASNR